MYGTGVLLLVLVGGICLHSAAAFSDGDVRQACSGMVPNHGANRPSSNPAPYKVISESSTYSAGDEITVMLRADRGAFRGFLLQAREMEGNKAVGTFAVNGSEAQLLTCDGLADAAVSHTSNIEKTTINATWKAPSNGNLMGINFRATFVEDFSTFWVGVQSDRVDYNGTETSNSSPSYCTSTALLSLLLLSLF